MEISQLNEEEIMQGINRTISFMKEELKAEHSCFTIKELWALQGLVDLYQAEKEKNKELYEDNQKQWEERCKLTFEFDNYISKDKIKEKIEELKDRKLLLKEEQDYYERSVLDDQIDILEELLKE